MRPNLTGGGGIMRPNLTGGGGIMRPNLTGGGGIMRPNLTGGGGIMRPNLTHCWDILLSARFENWMLINKNTSEQYWTSCQTLLLAGSPDPTP